MTDARSIEQQAPGEIAEPFDITRERLNRGLSIKGLAREAGVHEHSIRSIAAGRNVARPETVKKIADYFGVLVTDIVRPAGDES